jgi:hypothetical protein
MVVETQFGCELLFPKNQRTNPASAARSMLSARGILWSHALQMVGAGMDAAQKDLFSMHLIYCRLCHVPCRALQISSHWNLER